MGFALAIRLFLPVDAFCVYACFCLMSVCLRNLGGNSKQPKCNDERSCFFWGSGPESLPPCEDQSIVTNLNLLRAVRHGLPKRNATETHWTLAPSRQPSPASSKAEFNATQVSVWDRRGRRSEHGHSRCCRFSHYAIRCRGRGPGRGLRGALQVRLYTLVLTAGGAAGGPESGREGSAEGRPGQLLRPSRRRCGGRHPWPPPEIERGAELVVPQPAGGVCGRCRGAQQLANLVPQ